MKLIEPVIDLRPQIGDRSSGGISPEVFTSDGGNHRDGQNRTVTVENPEARRRFDKLVATGEKIEILIDTGRVGEDSILMRKGNRDSVLSTHPLWHRSGMVYGKRDQARSENPQRIPEAGVRERYSGNDVQDAVDVMRWLAISSPLLLFLWSRPFFAISIKLKQHCTVVAAATSAFFAIDWSS